MRLPSILVSAFDACLQAIDTRIERSVPRRFRDAPLAALLLAPALALLGVFGLFPLFNAVYLSLFELRTDGQQFVGLAHYGEALGGAPFWSSFIVTLTFCAITVPAAMALSFLVASALFRITRFRALYRTLYFLPYVTSVVAAAMVWRALYEPSFGAVNQMLGLLGLPAQQWLIEPRGLLSILTNGAISHDIGPSLALCCVMLFQIWHTVGFMTVVLLAGLTAVPQELEDAARIDGASWIQRTRHVTLPLLSPTLFFLGIVGVIGSFQAFNSFYALTGNGRGPLDTTQSMTVYIYTNFYEYGRLGYGSAVAVLLCLIIVGFTLLQWRAMGRKVYYR